MEKEIKILLLDDDDRVRFNLKLYFEDEGFICHDYETAELALQALDHHYFDIAVVDLRLPGMNGEEFIFEAASRDSSLEYIIHTGSNDYSLPSRMKIFGLTEEDVLSKPVSNMSIFTEIIKRKISLNKNRGTNYEN